MKKSLFTLIAALVFLGSGCSSEQATEEAVKGFLSGKINDLKDQIPEKYRALDSLLIKKDGSLYTIEEILLDSVAFQKKINEYTAGNLDSLEKYNKLLLEAKNMLKKDVSELSSDGLNLEN